MAEQKPLEMIREFKSNREKVWQAWTDPKQLAQWWSPDGFTIPVCELDVRVDGKMRIDMKGPDGTVYPSGGKYLELDEPNKLVFLTTPTDDDGKVLFEIKQTVVLTEKNGGTQLHLTAEVVNATPEAAPFLAGMEEGMIQCFGKLAKLV